VTADFVLSPHAIDDLHHLWLYLNQHAGAETADRVEDEIFSLFAELARMPGIGHRRADLTSRPVLFSPIYSYLIVHQPVAKPLVIHAVLHGARDVENVLKQRAF